MEVEIFSLLRNFYYYVSDVSTMFIGNFICTSMLLMRFFSIAC